MTIQTAISAALSGLRASQVLLSTTSHNIANAQTEGFVRKDTALSNAFTAGVGQGVKIDGITRNVDEILIRDSRFETSRYSGSEVRASLLSDYTTTVGQPEDERSPAAALNNLKLAFSQLRSLPDASSARSAVVDKSTALASSIRSAAQAATAIQTDARDRLETSVDTVNADLRKVSDLNKQIASGDGAGIDTGDLRDERDRLLDGISEEIGIRTYTRADGQVTVMTRNGQTLLDREIGPTDEPLRLVGTTLSVGGHVISTNPDTDIQSGRIMGYIEVADQDVPKILEQLDNLAAGLVQGFQGAEANPARAGLFTDGGAAYTTTPGLAGRVQVNAAVSTDAWRAQSGAQAATQLATGDQTQIDKFLAVFTATQTFTSPDTPSSTTLGDFASSMVSTQQGYRTSAENEMNSRKISADTLQSARINRDGVNKDDEVARLQLIEQSYAASAQVIQTAGQMLDILLSLRN